MATLLWGSAFPAVKIGYRLGNIGPDDLFLQLLYAGVRFTAAGLILCMLGAALNSSPLPRTRRQAWFGLRVASVQTVLQYLFFYVGIAFSSGVSASIIAGTLTFFQLAIAHFRYADDRLTSRKLLAALVGFGAIAFYQVQHAGGYAGAAFGVGEAAMLAAMFFAAFGNVMNRESRENGWSPLRLTGFQMTVGGMILGTVGLVGCGHRWPELSPAFFGVLVYLSFVSAGSFLLWNSLMTFNRPGSVAIFLFLVPVFGVLLSSIALHEPFDARVLPALAIIAASIVAAQGLPRSGNGTLSNGAAGASR
ncbi:DMT family transporter [Parasulfuritortus cantonensis]|nr:DMT family transporter [Parasulfuritortus cantonensis]